MIKHLMPITSLFIILIVLTSCQRRHAPDISSQESIPATRESTITSEANFEQLSLFDKVLEEVKAEVDAEIRNGIEVPIPRDMAGGYTHERHKRNFFILQKAGNLYTITNENKYLNYIKESLIAYAKLYPTLPLHPTQKSYATGKIFWQCLNDANWLVYVSQAYAAIYESLSEEERIYLETDLFRPMADFLSIENPQFFNRIHNHSTWANAAVGMIGLVMDDGDLVDKALYGLPIPEGNSLDKDNDGGYIYEKGMAKAGFLAQLDGSFAPDGYFTEGPYYLRYAIFPFLIFSKALSKHMPELNIMNYRNGIMTKAIYALLNQTDANGRFFPINDAQKGMSWNARELVSAVNILYFEDPSNKTLLDIARRQGKVLLDETGQTVSDALQNGEAQPYHQVPMIYGDGKDGNEGGVGILRNEQTCLVMKYSAQGMGHGHFDKLSYSLYDDQGEVVQDYGAARWVNIDQKGGGRYLKENQTFAKQSIAHNTAVLDNTSHYEGMIEKGELDHPYLFFADYSDLNQQIMSAKDTNAYEGIELHRTMILLTDQSLPNPLTIDLFRISGAELAQVDLPLWFQGHVLATDFTYIKSLESLQSLGDGHGYQHIWKEASATIIDDGMQLLTWFAQGKFYTTTFTTSSGEELIIGMSGANDPSFNLRNDQVLIRRKANVNNTLFASVVESHGTYNPIDEIPINPYTDIKNVEVLQDDEAYTVVNLTTNEDLSWTIGIANQSNDKAMNHSLSLADDKKLEWKGPYTISKLKN